MEENQDGKLLEEKYGVFRGCIEVANFNSY